MQIEQLDGQKAARRAAELMAILETASAKIDRFGWDRMDPDIKDQLNKDWCNVLSVYTIDEVRAGADALFAATDGNLRTINEHQVKAQIMEQHRRLVAELPQQVQRRECIEPTGPQPEDVEHRRRVAAEAMAMFRMGRE